MGGQDGKREAGSGNCGDGETGTGVKEAMKREKRRRGEEEKGRRGEGEKRRRGERETRQRLRASPRQAGNGGTELQIANCKLVASGETDRPARTPAFPE